MANHFKSFSAVFPIICKDDASKSMILLHRRKNTGYQDGKWDIAGSGHVDEGESAKQAVVRECKEELGIHVRREDVTFAHLSRRLTSDRTYYDIYFTINRYTGTPAIMEPDKCDDLRWFLMDELPDDMIECRKSSVRAFMKQCCYSELVEA